jgi:hypothetical protein
VLSRECSVIEEGLMLHHTFWEWDIIVFAPSTERVEEEDGVLVSCSLELNTCIFQEEAVTVVEGVTDLEGIASIGLLCCDGIGDFLG